MINPGAAARPLAFLPNWPGRLAWLALIVYSFYAASILDVTWERFLLGVENGIRFLGRMFPPDTDSSKLQLLAKGLYESIEMAIIASALGIVLSLPIGLLAARNLMPAWITWPMRLFSSVPRKRCQVLNKKDPAGAFSAENMF